MRPSTVFLSTCTGFCLLSLVFFQVAQQARRQESAGHAQLQLLIQHLGLSDLCLATDARYIRHLAVSDGVAPFMDQPGAIEHFPTGTFWKPPTQ